MGCFDRIKIGDIREKITALKYPSTYYTISAFFLISFLNFGPGFSYDNPAALEKQLLRTLQINNAEYEVLYLTTSWPNILFPIIGGYLLDRIIGYRFGTILYTSCVVLGQALFILGAGLNLFWLMCIGRFFFGIGTENTTVAQFTYAGRWFKGGQISIVFGAMFTLTRLGSILDFNLTPALFSAFSERFQLGDNLSISLSFALGFCFCTLSLFLSIILAIVDKKAEKHVKFNEKVDEKRNFRPTLKNFKFPISVWLIFLVIISTYLIFPFITLAPVFFQTKYGYSSSFSSFTVSIFFITVTIVSSINGLFVDRIGKNLLCVLIANVITIISHSILAFTFWPPALPAVFLGFAYSLGTTALWPLPTYVLSVNQLGTTYGCALAALSLGEGIFSILSGVILDNFGYLSLEVFFILFSLVGLFWAIILFCTDYVKGGVLNEWGVTRRNKKEPNEKKKKSDTTGLDEPLIDSQTDEQENICCVQLQLDGPENEPK